MIGAVGSGANGHCIALNNIRTYLTTSNHMERSKFLVDFSNNDNENIISSEGCFACDMNKANKRSSVRGGASNNEHSRKGRKGRRLRNRENIVGRNRRHKRNNQQLLPDQNRLKNSKSFRKVRKKRYSIFQHDISVFVNTTIQPFDKSHLEQLKRHTAL